MADRKELLESLLQFERPLADLRDQLSQFEWDGPEDIVELRSVHACAVLDRFLTGSVTENQVEDWANLIEGREDIGYESREEKVLREAIHFLANPALEGKLDEHSATKWLDSLRKDCV